MNEVSSCYVHIPFCSTICSYCDFCKVFYDKDTISSYLKRLSIEIDENYKKEKLSTLYIGGGTPSSFSLEELEKLFSILSKFKLEKKAEVTFECNIESLTEKKLQFLKAKGVNRLSIGVQTFHVHYLHYLNRKHTKEEVFQKIELAKKIGFTNINIDLMYGFKGESLEEVMEDVDLFFSLDIPHLSIYSLQLEPHTSLFINGEEPIEEEREECMYFAIVQKLKEKGYIHYEVSNFARKGYASFHNLTYWNNEHYYGFGAGASGYIGNTRFSHTRNVFHYNKGEDILLKEELDLKRTIENALILGFRKIEGICKDTFYQKYKIKIEEIKGIQKLLKQGKLRQNDTHIYINPNYIYVMNEILIEFIDSEDVT